MSNKVNKILMVLTSHDQLGASGEKTGFWVEEFAAPYYVFKDARAEVAVASVKGGLAPIDPKSELPDFQTESTKRFNEDKSLQQIIANTLPLEMIDEGDYDAVFYPGGHGPLWDLTQNTTSIELIEGFLNAHKPVSAVCHATAAFLNVKNSDNSYMVGGKAITGFSNAEEEAVQLTDIVPFLLEDELKKRGAEYQCVADWNPFAVQDGLVITGQNPASSELVAEKLLQALRN